MTNDSTSTRPLIRLNLVDLRRAGGAGLMLRGMLWSAAGAVITGASYLFGRPGGTYVIAWGAMAYGIGLLIAGAIRYFGAGRE